MTPPPPTSRITVRRAPALAVAVGAALLGGCATARPAVPTPADLARAVAELGIDPETVPDPTALDEEMARWVDEEVDAGGRPRSGLDDLLFALGGLRLEYANDYTGTAREVFRTRRYNCLSFSHLYVGMARHLGIDAYYVLVEGATSYDREGDLVLVRRHVTSGFGDGPERLVVDFDVGPAVDYRLGRRISDLAALSLHYSNRGAELLQSGEVGAALDALGTAVAVDPGQAGNWVNLGVARRRSGDFAGAEEAYRHAALVDPTYDSAFLNLFALLRALGRHDAAGELMALLGGLRIGNPYTYLALGAASLEDGDLEAATKFYRRARAIDRSLAEAAAGLGLVAAAEGRIEVARKWLRRATERDPTDPWVAELEERITRADQPPN